MPLSVFPEIYSLNSTSIIVDDADPAIQYHGTWTAANETSVLSQFFMDQTPTFNTLHVLQIFNGSFSYNFTGTS